MDITLPYRILAVDPATTKSGWSTLDLVSLNPLKIIIVASGQIDGDVLFRNQKKMALLFKKQFCVLESLRDIYKQLIEHWKPDKVVSESAFAHLHISAALALTLAIHELRWASREILGHDIVEIPPTISKMSFTGKGTADKDHMRLAYQTNDFLAGTVADDMITEHEIDSISHGCAHVRRDIIGDVVQVSAKDKRRLKREKAEKKKAIGKGEA